MKAGVCRWCWALAALALIAFSASALHAESKPIRVAVVNTPQFSGLMDALIADFKAATGSDVVVYSGSDVFDRARNGEADLVIAHYGKSDFEDFVLKGYGSWPRMVFSNQMAIIGPPEDPAGIRGMDSAAKALRRIAETKSPFIAMALPTVNYATEVLWQMSGAPDKTGWFFDEGLDQGRAIREAATKRAYVIFGAWPFLRMKQKQGNDLEILVAADPILQRVMASVVVSASKIPGANEDGARAFEKFLMLPKTQARIAAFRSHDSPLQLWWPAARHNDNGVLGE